MQIKCFSKPVATYRSNRRTLYLNNLNSEQTVKIEANTYGTSKISISAKTESAAPMDIESPTTAICEAGTIMTMKGSLVKAN